MVTQLSVGVVGVLDPATRYLLQLLVAHPWVDLTYIATPTSTSKRLGQIYPTLSGCDIETVVPETFDAAADVGLAVNEIASQCQVVFLNLPLGAAVAYVPKLMDACLVIDLSPDYRFRNLSLYQQCFQIARQDFAVAVNAVYGLPEYFGAQFSQSPVIGCAASAPTASLLALMPLLKRGLIEPDRIILNVLRGQTVSDPTALRLTRHPHMTEIEHIGGDLIGSEILVQYIPQAVSQPFGLQATLCADLRDPGLVAEDLVTIYRTVYQRMPWVKVLSAGQRPAFDQILGTNYCYLGVEVDTRSNRILVFSSLDPNLKGGVGQAVQCLNVTQGWDEEMGLSKFGYS